MRKKHTQTDGTVLARGDKHKNGNALDGIRHEADPFPERLTPAEKRKASKLTFVERTEWRCALKVIEKGWKTVVEVGLALRKIRESRLYREDHDSWEAFCRAVVGISKTEANRQILDAEVVEDLTAPNGVTAETGVQPPSKRSQVRALTRLKKPEDRREAWRRVCETSELTGRPATAELVTEVIEAIRCDADPPPASSHPPDEKPSTSVGRPSTAMDVLKRLRAASRAQDWAIVDEVIEYLAARELQPATILSVATEGLL